MLNITSSVLSLRLSNIARKYEAGEDELSNLDNVARAEESTEVLNVSDKC